MKLKPANLKLVIKILIILMIALLALTILFFNKSRFIKPSANNQSPAQTANTPLTTLPDQRFTPRDPSLNNEQNLVKDYLAGHLTELSPTKEVLGGKFYLTDIKFTDDHTATISYEDGHIALEAKVNYSLDAQKLIITSFKITKEN